MAASKEPMSEHGSSAASSTEVRAAAWMKPEIRVEHIRITRSGGSFFNDAASKPEPWGGV